MGGAQSYFAINIDGSPGPELTTSTWMPGIAYIFSSRYRSIRIPQTSLSSFRIVSRWPSTAIRQYIQLQAWGQNANFLRNQVLTGNTVWNSTLPYVIQGGLQIDTGAMLTIPAGCRIYFHADAPLLVDGSLQVIGTDSNRVLFTGDRMDPPYNGYPGSWPGIYFRGA